MKTYTVEQIRNYLKKQDSFGDVMYNLKEENIDKANQTVWKCEDCGEEYSKDIGPDCLECGHNVEEIKP